jgi:hypothetical protein
MKRPSRESQRSLWLETNLPLRKDFCKGFLNSSSSLTASASGCATLSKVIRGAITLRSVEEEGGCD